MRLGAFVDALTNYVVDPTHWEKLTDELDRLDLSASDPGDLLVQLSKAERLSWEIKNDSGDLAGEGFAFVLLDTSDRVVGHSENILQLREYLEIDGARLIFTHADSHTSLDEAKNKLKRADGAHVLVEISHPRNQGHRFGYLVAGEQFPEPLKLIAKDAVRALLIAQEQPNEKLRSIVQSSFSLTAAETDIMLKIASGKTIKSAAEELGVSTNTVRNHLQSIYDKSGINRQGDLVLVVTQLSIILAATGKGESGSEQVTTESAAVPPQHFLVLPDGRRLAYRTYGNPMNHPVLYLHESIGSSRLLIGTAELAEQLGIYIVAPDRPGFGHSDPNPDFNFSAICADLVYLLDHLRIGTCHVLGYISGGGYGVKLADEYPDRVKALTLVAARAPIPHSGRYKLLASIRHKMVNQPWVMSTFFNVLRNRASEETFGRIALSIYGAVAHDREFMEKNQHVFNHMVQAGLESLSVTASGVINELQCFNNATDVTMHNKSPPISVWHGTEDALSSLEELLEYLSNRAVKVHTFAEVGSIVLYEYWPEILKEVAEVAAE